MSIAAIETTYKGKRFRSRLEVRWAMFFDELGIEWEYEPRQFGCPTAFYVPDFYLPGHKKFVEVKPENMLKFPPKVYLAGRMTRVMDSTIHPDGRRVPQDISCVGANSGDTPPGYSVKEYPDWSSDEGTRTAVEERWRCYRPFDTDFYIPEQIQGRNYRWIGKRLIDYRGPFTYADMSHGCLDNEGH